MEERELLYEMLDISQEKIKNLEDIQDDFLNVLNEENIEIDEQYEIYEELNLITHEIDSELILIQNIKKDIVNTL